MPDPNTPMDEAAEEKSEQATVPFAALAGAKVGDTVSFTVDAINGDMATISPVESEEQHDEPAPAGSAISQASKMFNGDE